MKTTQKVHEKNEPPCWRIIKRIIYYPDLFGYAWASLLITVTHMTFVFYIPWFLWVWYFGLPLVNTSQRPTSILLLQLLLYCAIYTVGHKKRAILFGIITPMFCGGFVHFLHQWKQEKYSIGELQNLQLYHNCVSTLPEKI